MEISSQRAQEIIEGIRDLGCRLSGLDPKQFRAKPGGSYHRTSAVIDCYFSDQNNEASVNSKKAYEQGLIRRTYSIFRAGPNEPVVLRILEWSAAVDVGTSEYRNIWTKRVDERGAKEEMAKYFANNFLAKAQ